MKTGGVFLNQRLERVFTFFEKDLPDYYKSDEIRLSQIEMAIAISAFLSTESKKQTLLIHAPVGTGKTFAALMPICYEIKNKNKRLIYATSSLNLQAQLKNEELKVLHSMKEVENYIIAKGVNHYVCYKRIIESTKIPNHKKEVLGKYALESIEGDRVEFEKNYYPLSDDEWESINLKSQKYCNSCDCSTICSTNSHRKKYNNSESKIIVTNHNQLIQSVINNLQDKYPIIDYNNPGGFIIIDEAHDFGDAVLNQLSEELKLETLDKIICDFFTGDVYRRCLLYKNIIKDEMNEIKKEYETTSGRRQISKESMNALNNLNKIFHDKISESTARKMNKIYYEPEPESELENISVGIDKIADQNYTSWFDLEKDSIVFVSNKYRIKTKEIISNLAENNKIIFMSGTLAVNNSFDHIYYNFGGYPPKHDEKIFETVFELNKQAIVYIPKGIPKPVSSSDKGFDHYCKTLSIEILKLIDITGGRTLILSTSHKQMELLYKNLKPSLDKRGITFLKQGQKSIELLTEVFKEDETSVLIGTGSFFAGLSVKGKSLISVILCRLPFSPPDDPFINLIAEDLSEEEKMEIVNFPRMVIRLMQAGGRLIRTIEDFGCFTILDPRAFEKGYSRKIISELKKAGYGLTRKITDVKQFIDNRMNSKGFAKYPDYLKDKISIPEELIKEEIRNELSPIDLYSSKETAINSTGLITPSQEAYYRKIRKKVGLNVKLLNKIKEPYDLYEYLMDLNADKGLNEPITENFPFVSEEQRSRFDSKYKYNNQRKSTAVKTYYLSEEEKNKYKKVSN